MYFLLQAAIVRSKLLMKISLSFVHKASAAALTLALIASLVWVSGVQAAGTYSISGSHSVVGTVLTLNGTSGANPDTGADNTQHMAVDWDEDQDGDPETGIGWEVAPSGGLTFSPTFFGGNGNNSDGFNATWGATNDYSAFGSGSYTVRVMVYHGNTPGQDGDAQAAITFNVVIAAPECSDGDDNDSDDLTDYPSDPGCSSETDDDEFNEPANTAPVITLVGADPLNITVGGSYTDPGATADDAEDGDITGDIVVGGDTVDVNTVGTYVVTYDVEDSDGLDATQVTRTVNVTPTVTECNDGIDNDGDGQIDTADSGCPDAADNNENTPPVITLTGDATINLTVGDTYTEPGAAAADNEDNPDPAVVIGGATVDTNVTGTYVITYDATDSDGATAVQVTRTVNVNPGQSGPSRYTLSITTSGEGNGVVLGTGINCDSNFVASEETPANDCEETYDENTAVDLTVTLDEGSSFDGSWVAPGAGTCTGTTNPCSVTMNGPISLNAHFSLVQTTTTGGGGGGGNRNRNNDDDDGEVLGEVLGAQVAAVPVGAPATGAGGTGSLALTALIAGLALIGNRKRA